MKQFNRIDIKLGVTMVLLILSILLPLGYVVNQIFYSFYIQQTQENKLNISAQYASILSDENIENAPIVIEAAAKISNQKIVILEDDTTVVGNTNIVLSKTDIEHIVDLLQDNNRHPYLTNDLKLSNGVTMLATASLYELNEANGHIIVFESLDSVIQSMKTVQLLIFVSVAGAFLIGIGLAYFLSRKLSSPLVNIEKATREIAKGEFNFRVQKQSNDEIGSLVDAINDLAEELDRVNTQRKEFFADISHELQTPITYLKGYANVLKREMWQSETERKQYLDILEEEANRLALLINDLSDLAKMEEGHFNFTFKFTDIEEVVKSVVKKTRHRALEKGIVLSYENKMCSKPIILADSIRLEQAIFNIIENAIRYTNEGCIVTTLTEQEHSIILKIKDTGIGISKEKLPFIFERFFRVEKSRSRIYGGSGLGLPIVKQIIDKHSGTTSITSDLGMGTTVIIRFPKPSSME